MRDTPLVRPEYASRFKCIGGACEDTCCAGWSVHVDQEAFERYQALPAGPLQTLLQERIKRTGRDGEAKSSPYASIELLPGNVCPFLNERRRCMIQEAHGEAYLCNTCAVFPRTPHRIDGQKEISLSLSCPEAARLVLQSLKLMKPVDRPLLFTWDETVSMPIACYFWLIREAIVRLIQNRAYAVWQRVFLLGIFTRRLEAIRLGQLQRDVTAFLDDFAAAIDTRKSGPDGELRKAMQHIPVHTELQLEMVLELVNLSGRNRDCSTRLHECLRAFASGIGNKPGGSMQDQVLAYKSAAARYFEPFFRRHPHMLENYLVNEVFRRLFPFGEGFSARAREQNPDFEKAYAMLVLQFALIQGLLIGVAGFYKKDFSAAHVVQVVQTVFKGFEHSPKFLENAYGLLKERHLNTPHGLAALIRN